MADEHMGRQISVAGFSGVGLSGARRHPRDTQEAICLTLYGQDGDLQEMMVRRTRDMEVFQEWLRRFDRRLPGQLSPPVPNKGGR
jgi:hypothetical protein